MKNIRTKKKRLRFRCLVDNRTRDQLKKVWLEKGSGLSAEQLARTKVKLDEITTAPEAFQPRTLGEDYRITRHVDDLTRTAKQQAELDPVLLFAIDGRRYVLDGHLRLRAFAKAGRRPSDTISVSHFPGPFDDALLCAIGENAKAKLSLTREQRTESAWSLAKWSITNGGCYSKATISKRAGVSDGTVAQMRRVLKRGPTETFDPFACTWAEVLWRLRPESHNEFVQERQEAKIEQWALGFRRTTGKAGDRNPDAAKEAFERSHPRAAALIRDEGTAEVEDEGYFNDDDRDTPSDF